MHIHLLRYAILGFLTLNSFLLFAQNIFPEQINQLAIKYLQKDGYALPDYSEMKVSDHYFSKNLGIYHTYYQQFYAGIPVENAILNTAFKDDKMVNAHSGFVKNIQVDTTKIAGAMAPERGLSSALNHLGIEVRTFLKPKNSRSSKLGNNTVFEFEKSTISKIDMEVYLVWVKEGNSLRLCWENVIEPTTSSKEYYLIQVDAYTGEFVKKENRIIECKFDKKQFENYSGHELIAGKKLKEVSKKASVLANTYNVFDLPIESPSHGSRSLTASPWLRAGIGNPATTLGWHNDGAAYTITRGNNVHAYEDQDANNLPGYSPNGGGALDFNFSLNLNNAPGSNLDASITNLFHTCNLVHDITYQYGFDEVAGNFQQNNLGRGGAGNDYVLAEALDGSGLDNANFSTPADGNSGRMQMFLWTPVSPPVVLTVNSPNTLPNIAVAESGFSTNNKIANVGSKTGNIVLVNDGTANPSLGCSALVNGANILGNIALIDRGSCNFTVKVKNAQNAGAIAAIVVNNIAGQPTVMGGTDNTITIPAVMISNINGTAIKNALLNGSVNVTLSATGAVNLDGSYDNGVVIHEYGHGISNRLTGGPAAAGCLGNQEQMGEGWSDFLALMLATNWSSAIDTMRRGIGTYVIGEMPNGTGIRTYPYTTNMAVNPFTYANVANAPLINGNPNNPSPHYIGSIWATMLWDMTWKIIALEGIDTDIYHGTGGNNIALELVMAGMKLQPCSPGFVDGRNAILLADQILYNGVHQCAIWSAFAQRGLGKSASQGSSASFTDGIAAFDLPDGVFISKSLDKVIAFEGESINITSSGKCNCATTLNFQLQDSIPVGFEIVNINNGTLLGNKVVSDMTNLQALDELAINYTIRAKPCNAVPLVMAFDDNIEGGSKFTSSKLGGTGTNEWINSSTLANSPSKSWYAINYDVLSDFVLTQNSTILLSNAAKLSFYHRFETEENWDGGVVEISDEGGPWTDLGPYFIQNGYPSFFASNGASNLAGRSGFTGNSNTFYNTTTFVESIVDLSAFAGKNIRIRFRFASDDNTAGSGINGWYVDDITIINYSGAISDLVSFQNSNPLDTISIGLSSQSLNQKAIFVDQNAVGLNFGGNWPDAFPNLADAILITGCHNIDSVFIAAGTYLPTNNRDSSFLLTDTVQIFGGFPNGGSIFSARNPQANPTILSGDIGSPGNNTDNNYHVVTVSANGLATMDGIYIQDGNANGGGEQNKGAGIYNAGKLILKDSELSSNSGASSVHNTPSARIEIRGNTKM